MGKEKRDLGTLWERGYWLHDEVLKRHRRLWVGREKKGPSALWGRRRRLHSDVLKRYGGL